MFYATHRPTGDTEDTKRKWEAILFCDVSTAVHCTFPTT